ncbi:MAG: tetratricopeptide repeat protein [Anaerolineae bacterium]|nr:tetratricopeptide repeat protein [Anaerolineae bacterium]
MQDLDNTIKRDQSLNHCVAFWRRWLERYQRGVAHSSRAWALAQLGRRAESAQALEQALAAADRRFVPEFAGVLYRAGQAEWLLGDRDKAIEHWGEARRLDPRGHFGGLADQALGGPEEVTDTGSRVMA